MPSFEHLIPFFVATFLIAVFPGPALLYTAAQTIARGRLAGCMAALGIHIGGYVHILAAVLGLSAIFRHVPELYFAIKLAGAAYLVWLGIGILRGRMDADALPQVRARSARRALAESIVVQVLNPKVALFYIAFLPQFVDPAATAPVWLQLLALGVIVNGAFATADFGAVFLTSGVLSGLRRSHVAARIARLFGGSALIGLGTHLAVSRN